MPILRHDPKRIKGRSRAQNRAHIVRIGHLIENEERPVVPRPFGEQITQPHFLKRFNLKHQALVRRVPRDHPAQISNVGIDDLQILGDNDLAHLFARAPQLAERAIGVVHRGINGMTPPKTGATVWRFAYGFSGSVSSAHRAPSLNLGPLARGESIRVRTY